MLRDKNAVANIAVKDIERARRFYRDILGLAPVEEMMGELLVFKSGDSIINVYRSDKAGTNQATAMTWSVEGDMENVVRELKDKGISFEHYDMPDMKLEGDVYSTPGQGQSPGMKVAWFKDPDGNILNIAGR